MEEPVPGDPAMLAGWGERMTGPERQTLGVLLGLVQRMDDRLRHVEEYVTADSTRNQTLDEINTAAHEAAAKAEESRSSMRRWTVGLTVSSLISTAGIIIALVKFLTG